MCGTILSQYYRFTGKTKIFRDFVKNRKKRNERLAFGPFFTSKRIGYGTVRPQFDLFSL